MIPRTFLTTVTVVAVVASSCLAEEPLINVTSIHGAAMRMDGRLDEVAWTSATPVILTQQSPHPGAASPYITTLRVVADQNNLYFGFTCTDLVTQA